MTDPGPDLYYGPHVAGVAAVSLVLFVAFCLLVLYLLLQGPCGRLLPCQLAANVLLGHLVPALLLHPASIHLRVLGRPMSTPYCWLYQHAGRLLEVLTPYMLFMVTIERMMYVRDPTAHAQRIKRAGAIALLVFPWVWSVLLTVITINATTVSVGTQHVFVGPTTNHTVYGCYRHTARPMLDLLFRAVLGFALPILTCLAMAVTVLVLWGNYKRKTSLGVDYSLLGQKGEAAVRDSVLAVALLTFLYIPVFFTEVFIRSHIPMTFSLLSLYGVVEGVVWVSTIAEVRSKFVGMFRLCRSKTNNRTPIVKYMVKDASTT